MKITVAKYMGDDKYSWAVFIDSRPVLTGLTRSTARYERERIKREEKKASEKE